MILFPSLALSNTDNVGSERDSDMRLIGKSKIIDCAKIEHGGKSLHLNGNVLVREGKDSLTGVPICAERVENIVALIEKDDFETISIKGDDSYLGMLLIELAGVIPRLKKLKTLNLDAYYPSDYLDNDIRNFSDLYKDNHGLVINFVYDGSVILKRIKIK